MRQYYLYILASERNGTLYIGVTSNLVRRVNEHVSGTIEGFTKTYSIKRLVYFEVTESVEAALYREKQLKRWDRSWKLRLIEDANPNWNNLAEDF